MSKELITNLLSALVASSDVYEANESSIVESAAFFDDVIGLSVNTVLPEFIAQHRSHSSHASHGSHRSSSGGSARPSPRPAPAPSQPLSRPPKPPGVAPPPSTSRTNPNVDEGATQLRSALQDKESRQRLVLRVQIMLFGLGFYIGELDGLMGPQTRAALNSFRISRSLDHSETIDLPTLNALGIRAT